MEAVVVDAGSKLLKAGFALPDQEPSMGIREQLVQLMFETFNVTGFYASEQAVLSLYAVGRISGCAVDVGHGKIDLAPVWEGAVQHNALKRFDLGGVDLTELFARELGKSNPQISIDLSIVEKLKETHACTAEDQIAYEETQRVFQTEKHTLPDGQVISIGRERYTVGEALFQPSILGIEEHDIVEQLIRSVSCVPFENQRQLLENTVLCGGTAAMSGFDERFQKEAIVASSPSIRPALVKAVSLVPGKSYGFPIPQGRVYTIVELEPQSATDICVLWLIYPEFTDLIF